jgi:hypothetical protein
MFAGWQMWGIWVRRNADAATEAARKKEAFNP